MALEGISHAMARIEEIRSKIRSIAQQVTPPASDAAKSGASDFASQLAAASSGSGVTAGGLSRAPEPYRSMLQGAASRHNVPMSLLESVARRESGFDPRAVSPRGAQGIMQIMPATQAAVGVTDPFDAGQSIEGGARYLRMMLDRFGGDTTRALAAYNAGPGAVERHNGVPPFAETRDYVTRILSDMSAYESESPE